MKSFFALGLSLVVVTATTALNADPYGSPSTLPYTSTPYANNGGSQSYYTAYSYAQEEVKPGVEEPASPSDDPAPIYPESAPLQSDAWSTGCADGSCGDDYYDDTCTSGNCCGCWFGSVAGLYMTRDDTDRLWLTSDGTDPTQVFLSNRDAEYGWEGGWELSLGRHLSKCTKFEVTYWQLGGFNGFGSTYDGGDNLVSTMDFGNVDFGGDAASGYFDGSREHRVWRNSDIRNLELNFWHQPVAGNCNSCFQVDFLAGLRYFNYDNGFLYGARAGGGDWGTGGDIEHAYLGMDIENHLIGLQLGADLEYRPWCSLGFFAKPKMGFYANYMDQNTRLYRGDGTNATTTGGDAYPLASNKTDVSFIAEIETGLRWNISQCWSTYASYRAVAIAGVAHADQNIPFYAADTHGFNDIDSNGQMIVHGATFGLEYNW